MRTSRSELKLRSRSLVEEDAITRMREEMRDVYATDRRRWREHHAAASVDGSATREVEVPGAEATVRGLLLGTTGYG